jgi:hypothetical protein
MTDLVSGKAFMTEEETKFRSVIAEPYIQKIGSNINALIDEASDDFAPGTVIFTALDKADFDANISGTWEIPQGQSITGKDLNTIVGSDPYNLPDLRGLFLRSFDDGAGNDPGRSALTFQNWAVKEHDHVMINSDPANDTLSGDYSASAPFVGTRLFELNIPGNSGNPGTPNITGKTNGDQGIINCVENEADESRPYNVSCFIYIKVSN